MLCADGQDIAHGAVNLLDNEGHLIFDTNYLIMWEIIDRGPDVPGKELTTKHTKRRLQKDC